MISLPYPRPQRAAKSPPQRVGIEIIGCGNISEAYLKATANFPILDVRCLADIRPRWPEGTRSFERQRRAS